MNEIQKDYHIEEDEIDLLALFGVLFRYKLLIIIITLVSVLGAVGFSILSLVLPPEVSPLPNKYRPEALILVQDQQQGGGLSSMISSSGLGALAGMAGISGGGAGYGELAVKLLKSKSILDTIAGEFNLVERYKIEKHFIAETREEILENSSFDYDDKTNTITIAFEDYDPALATAVVNRIVELLDKRFTSIGGNKNLTLKNLLEEKLAGVSAEMSILEARIQDFQQEHGVLSIEELATEQITMLAKLRSQLILKEVEIKTYSDFSKIEDPVIKRLKSERENLLKLIREVESGFSSYEKIMPAQKDLPELALEFIHLKRDLFVQEKIYEIIIQQYELTKLSIEGEEPIFQVLELAEVPDKKSGPSRSLICIVTVFLAFFFSIIAVFILNAVKNIKSDPEKIKRIKGIS